MINREEILRSPHYGGALFEGDRQTSTGIELGLEDPLKVTLSSSSLPTSESTLTSSNLSLNNPQLVLRSFARGAGGWINNDVYPRTMADVNGDGKADIVGFANAGVCLSTSTGTGFSTPRLVLRNFARGAGGWINNNVYPRTLADVNGDGRADIVGFGNAGVYLSTSTGTGFTTPRLVLRNFGRSAGGWINNDVYPRTLADVNGDGKADIVGFGNAGVYLSTSTGTGFSAPRLVLRNFARGAGGWSSNNVYPRTLADVNGDGRADIVGFANAGVCLSTSTGTGFSAPRLVLRNFARAGGWINNDVYPRTVADVNGDGRADIVGFGYAGVGLSTSTGTGFTRPRLVLRSFARGAGGWSSNNVYPRTLADVNGDGLADIVGFGYAGVCTSITRDWYGQVPNDAKLVRLARLHASDGQLSRNDMIAILRNTEDGAVISSSELVDLRRIVSAGRSLMPGYVHNLSNKLVNGDPANAWWTGGTATRTALGNLVASSSATRMERLIGKWFLGLDRPTASSDTTYRLASGSLFQGGISYRDINQGNLGDCYLLASLAGTAFRSSSRIQNMFIDNGDGTYTVRFYNNGVADYVTVDKYLPFYSSGSFAGRFYYANRDSGRLYNNNANELWVTLLEKAYAQINESQRIGQDNTNTYAGISGGTLAAISHITGLSNTGYVSPFNTSELVKAYNANRITYLSDGGHAYTLVGYNSSTGAFTVYNPWGRTETYTNAQMIGKFRRFGYSGSRV